MDSLVAFVRMHTALLRGATGSWAVLLSVPGLAQAESTARGLLVLLCCACSGLIASC